MLQGASVAGLEHMFYCRSSGAFVACVPLVDVDRRGGIGGGGRVAVTGR